MTASDDAIARARSNLTSKLAELRRRETHVVGAIAPLRYLANPWLHLGIAVFVGYRLGRPHRVTGVVATPRADSMTKTIVRAGMIAAAEAIVRRVATALISVPPSTDPAS